MDIQYACGAPLQSVRSFVRSYTGQYLVKIACCAAMFYLIFAQCVKFAVSALHLQFNRQECLFKRMFDSHKLVLINFKRGNCN